MIRTGSTSSAPREQPAGTVGGAAPTPNEPKPKEPVPPGTARPGNDQLKTAPRTPVEAFDALYTDAAAALVRQAYLLTGNRVLARDSVERAFHTAWERWPEVAVDRDPPGWVRATVHDYALSPWHRLCPAHRRPDRASDPAQGEGPDAPALRVALLALPPVYRRALLLYDGVGLDLAGTAAETEASTQATGQRLLHARETIAELLPELGDDALLHDRLSALTRLVTQGSLVPPQVVRTGSERRVRFWTRSAITFTVLLMCATGFTLATAPTGYEAPLAPGERIGGAPSVRSDPGKLTDADLELREALRSKPMNGPYRLTPRLS
jgi:DNA-directed RNA polymerase specialized sigma24 family protein